MGAPREETDAELVKSAADGDERAFAELFNRYYSMIHAFAYRLCLCGSDAEDVAQATFIKAARGLRNFRRESSFKNWLYRIAVNAAKDLRRGNAKRMGIAEELELAGREPERTPDHGRVAEALGSLAEDLRETIVLVYYEEMSHAEVARILGCAEATVSWRVFQAKRRLRKLLKPDRESLPGGDR